MMDTGLADRLRYWLTPAGYQVVEIDGWQTRGRTYAAYAPQGGVQHHTAGALAGGDAPSLGIVINGRPDLPGPLAQVFGSRSLVAYVVAAGVANHAGLGSWDGLAGNASVGGLEMEYDGIGDEPRTERLMDFCARIQCALITAPGSPADPDKVCQHFEWSTEGKIDFYKWPGADLRARVAALLASGPGGQPTPIPSKPEEAYDMKVTPTSPCSLFTSDGHYHVLGLGDDTALYEKEYDGANYLDWFRIDSAWFGALDVVNSGDRIDVTGVGLDGKFYHCWRPNGGAWIVEPLGGHAEGGPKV